MLRRTLLKTAGLAGTASAAALLPLGRAAWAAVDAAADPRPRRLVVVFLRGAIDGLSVVVPYAEPAYHAARPSIALGVPGSAGGALDLDGRFGLHPALAPLLPLWTSGTLGFVHACGSPDPTRSHFDAQDDMETATPGRRATQDGWMNRLLGVLPGDAAERAAATRAVAVGPVLPRIAAGRNPVATIAPGAAATRPSVLDRPAVGDAFGQLYAGDDALSRAWRESLKARREVRQAMDAGGPDALTREMLAASNGAPLPNGFPDDAARLARLMRNDGRVRLAFMALGGWDTHASQGAAAGQLASRLQPLGAGLAALASGLGAAFDDTVIVVMSEFGRTVQQNGSGGTDHGHGNVMWLLGGRVAGRKVHGRWPGLDATALHEGRDLAVTTDFRAVLAEVAGRHLRLSDTRLAEVFPDFAMSGDAQQVLRA